MRKADYTKTGIILNIQKFSINDGPGIRTVVFFKGCPLHCIWCSNPESQLTKFQILWDSKKCIHCNTCINVCPYDAISSYNEHIYFNSNKCIECKLCIQTCPTKSLESQGEKKSIKETLEVVLQDKDFYEESGGGITLSGGEILYQPDFAKELVLAAKENGLHTCCETTGFAKQEIFNYVTQNVDYLLFDLKHWNNEKHKKGTGVSNQLPLLNMKHSISIGKQVLPRIPVILGFNNSLKYASEFANILHKVGATSCQILPFHQFGENKYYLLGKKYAYKNIPSLHQEDLQAYVNVLIDHGIKAFF